MVTDHEDDQPRPGVAPQAKGPQPQRPKMTLAEQATFLNQLCGRFRRSSDGALWGEVLTSLTQEDMLKLEAVHQTLMFMDMHRADLLVRDKISRDRRHRG